MRYIGRTVMHRYTKTIYVVDRKDSRGYILKQTQHIGQVGRDELVTEYELWNNYYIKLPVTASVVLESAKAASS